ncbi:MAG: UdgX family uracil-DNA binding protein [Dehalococcoidia bacterium]|nr:UdgX family uracil-DNA binding protein [Dehalococcoidia bacterium]
MTPEESPYDASGFVPRGGGLGELREAARACHGCPLWARGTQTVFGQGPARARIMLVGEQPGDVEDQEGVPFVGPAGMLLDRCLAAAGIDRGEVYVTNAVKHFKWEPRGKRRIHSKPNAREVRACKPWLEAELGAVRPEVVVCLGATAAQSLLGAGFQVTRHRGEFVASPIAPLVTATIHPSAVLRQRDDAARQRERELLIADLRRVRERLAELRAAG